MIELAQRREDVMTAPTRGGSDDGLYLLINSISEQVRHINEQQEQLRIYLLTQIDEMRATIIRREEHRDNLAAIQRDVVTLSTKVDRLEVSLTEKIEKVGKESKDQQEANYRTVIKVQATILSFIAMTIVGLVLKVFFHIPGP
jgi:hypothetical protein